MNPFTAGILRQSADIGPIVDEWRELWRRLPRTTPFQSPDWLVPWWKHFHPGELFIVTLRYESRLCALAPMYIESGQQGRRILPIGISLSDYLDVLIEPEILRIAGPALVARVEHEQGWDSWELEELPLGASALCLRRPVGCEASLARVNPCPFLELPTTTDALAGIVPPRKMRKWRMARRRIERRASFCLERIGTPEVRTFLQDLFDLHTMRWRARGEKGLLAETRVCRFLVEALQNLARNGIARLTRLTIDGRPAGAFCGLMHRGRFYAYIGGFDPAFAFESPGTILIGSAIEEAILERARYFDFLRGGEPYKYEWGAVDRFNLRRSFRRRGRNLDGRSHMVA